MFVGFLRKEASLELCQDMFRVVPPVECLSETTYFDTCNCINTKLEVWSLHVLFVSLKRAVLTTVVYTACF